jgi:hypothetical protein
LFRHFTHLSAVQDPVPLLRHGRRDRSGTR